MKTGGKMGMKNKSKSVADLSKIKLPRLSHNINTGVT